MPALSRTEKYLLSQFELNDWMRRDEIDPGKRFGRELRTLQQRGLIEGRQPHDFDREYALTDSGMVAVGLSAEAIKDLTTEKFRSPSTPPARIR